MAARDPADVLPAFWQGKRVFVSGHTGFKGSWLCSWLSHLGADVTGYALAPQTSPSLFEETNIGDLLQGHHEADIRDAEKLASCLRGCQPEVVFHLAAQPLVRESYNAPVYTFETNVMGTIHLLEAVRGCPSVRVVVVVTTDKVYENREWHWGYRERDPLGGHDPYSSSKAACEIATSAWRRSFFEAGSARAGGVTIASARAGNVLGGGDWSKDRLIPDAVKAVSRGKAIQVRNPRATRPWQHVIEPLGGYLMLAQAGYSDDSFAQSFNFGPDESDVRPVGDVISRFVQAWGGDASWRDVSDPNSLHEAGQLKLDSSKARALLGWRPRFSLDSCLELTANWYRGFYNNDGPERARHLLALMHRQLDLWMTRGAGQDSSAMG